MPRPIKLPDNQGRFKCAQCETWKPLEEFSSTSSVTYCRKCSSRRHYWYQERKRISTMIENRLPRFRKVKAISPDWPVSLIEAYLDREDEKLRQSLRGRFPEPGFGETIHDTWPYDFGPDLESRPDEEEAS